MKNKISASFLSALLLVTSIVSTTYAASNDKLQLIVDLGIVKPIETTGLIKKGFSRGDFALALDMMDAIRAADWKGYYGENEIYVSDVDGVNNENSIIEAIVAGWMETDGNGKFNASDSLTLNDAIKALVRRLRYDVLAVENGGTDSAYYAVAIKIGLMKGVKIADNQRLSQREAGQLIANAMQIKLFTYDEINLGDTCFFDFWNLTEHSGKLLANSNLGLEVSKTACRKINVDGTIYDTDLLVENELIGSNITFYTDADGKVISVFVNEYGKAVSLTTNDIDVVENNGTYFKVTDSKNKTYKLDASGYAIVNGKTMPPSDELFKALKSGTVTLLDTDGSGTYDVIHINMMYQTIIDGVSNDTQSLRTRFDNITLKEENYDVFEIYNNKKAAKLSDLKAGMAVGIVCDKFTIDESGNITYDFLNSDRICLYATNQVASGVVSGIKNNNIIILEDMEYQPGVGYDRLVNGGKISALSIGDSVDLYLDYLGNITYYEANRSVSSMSYGYIIKAGTDNRGLKNETKLKIIDEEGTVSVFALAKKFKLDGQKCDSGATTYMVGLNTVDLTKRQVIKYRVANGVIISVDTALVGPTENSLASLLNDYSFDPYIAGGTQVKIVNGIIDRRYAFTEDCVVFVDEASMTDTNPADEDFAVVSVSDLPDNAYIGGYDATEYNELRCVVNYKGYGFSLGDSPGSLYYYSPNDYVVEKVAYAIDKDGNYGYILDLCGDNKTVSYFASEENLKLYTANYETSGGWKYASSAEYVSMTKVDSSKLVETLLPGDSIRFQTNSKGNITYIEKLFDLDFHKNIMVDVSTSGGQVYGFVSIQKIGGKNVMYTDNSGTNYIYRPRSTYTKFPVFDVRTKRASMMSIEEIPTAASGSNVKAYLRYYSNGQVYGQVFYLFD